MYTAIPIFYQLYIKWDESSCTFIPFFSKNQSTLYLLQGFQPSVSLGLILSDDVVDTSSFQLAEELGQVFGRIHIAVGQHIVVLVINVGNSSHLGGYVGTVGDKAKQWGYQAFPSAPS